MNKSQKLTYTVNAFNPERNKRKPGRLLYDSYPNHCNNLIIKTQMKTIHVCDLYELEKICYGYVLM